MGKKSRGDDQRGQRKKEKRKTKTRETLERKTRWALTRKQEEQKAGLEEPREKPIWDQQRGGSDKGAMDRASGEHHSFARADGGGDVTREDASWPRNTRTMFMVGRALSIGFTRRQEDPPTFIGAGFLTDEPATYCGGLFTDPAVYLEQAEVIVVREGNELVLCCPKRGLEYRSGVVIGEDQAARFSHALREILNSGLSPALECFVGGVDGAGLFEVGEKIEEEEEDREKDVEEDILDRFNIDSGCIGEFIQEYRYPAYVRKLEDVVRQLRQAGAKKRVNLEGT